MPQRNTHEAAPADTRFFAVRSQFILND